MHDAARQGVHTSDMRRSKSFIHAREPAWLFERGFTEDDELWTPDVRETADEQQARARSALVEIFNGDNSTCACRGPVYAFALLSSDRGCRYLDYLAQRGDDRAACCDWAQAVPTRYRR